MSDTLVTWEMREAWAHEDRINPAVRTVIYQYEQGLLTAHELAAKVQEIADQG